MRGGPAATEIGRRRHGRGGDVGDAGVAYGSPRLDSSAWEDEEDAAERVPAFNLLGAAPFVGDAVVSGGGTASVSEACYGSGKIRKNGGSRGEERGQVASSRGHGSPPGHGVVRHRQRHGASAMATVREKRERAELRGPRDRDLGFFPIFSLF